MKKCKDCKKEFEPIRPLQSVCSPMCAINQAKKKKEKSQKEWNEKKKELKPHTHAKEYRKYLQAEINKLARIIDAEFKYDCIDGCGLPYGKQIDAAHYHSIGSNNSLRFNLHNIHSARSDCNRYSENHKTGYAQGLKIRYGKEYLEMIESLPNKYKHVKLSNVEVFEKLKIVRKLLRTFDTYKFSSPKTARETMNKIIGIYN